jgi:hypothetical protein
MDTRQYPIIGTGSRESMTAYGSTAIQRHHQSTVPLTCTFTTGELVLHVVLYAAAMTVWPGFVALARFLRHRGGREPGPERCTT